MTSAESGARFGIRRAYTLSSVGALLGLAFVIMALVSSCSQVSEGPAPVATATVARPAASVIPITQTASGQPAPTVTATPTVAVTMAASAAPEEAAPGSAPDLGYLVEALDRRLGAFDGLASYYVGDLHGGQFAVNNGDVAISGTSIVKIPILLETYRVLDEPPSIAEMRLITETATLSGNYTANLLLELIAGQPDPFAGAQQVTESMRGLGLYNTFIAVPYDLEPDPRYLSTYSTPANQNSVVSTNPDSSMQTTVSDMGRLLALLYECSIGDGYLLERFAGELSELECRQVIEVMSQNDIDAFIEEGVPSDVAVAHKHGWVGETHADAAIVRVAEQPYVLVVTLHRPGWLEWAESTVVIADVSRLAYAHFSDPHAYSADVLQRTPPTLPAAAPTPDLPTAFVSNTGGTGVVLRQSPGGAEIAVVPEGSLVFLLEDASEQDDGGRVWRHVRLMGETSGWLVSDFLEFP